MLEENYTLPDGRVIRIGRERFEAAEALFNPDLIDVESKTGGMSEMVFRMIQEVCGRHLPTFVAGPLIAWTILNAILRHHPASLSYVTTLCHPLKRHADRGPY